jgi:hypothetical protein
MKQKIQLIEKVITGGEPKNFSISEELDREYKYLTGIAILDGIGINNLFSTSSIDGSELFPKNFEVAFLQSSRNVAPDDRFFTLRNKKADGAKLDIDFWNGGSAQSYPYTLKIYLRLENEPRED